MKKRVGDSKPHKYRGWDFSVNLFEHEKGEFSAEVRLVYEWKPRPGKVYPFDTDIAYDSQEKAENNVVDQVKTHIDNSLGDRPKAK